MRIPHAATLLLLLYTQTTSGCAKEDACTRSETAFEDFVAANLSCNSDEDCKIIGDCGPNSDFRAVRASAADEAYRLAQERCSESWDGPVYTTRCVAGQCTLEMLPEDMCCGCP